MRMIPGSIGYLVVMKTTMKWRWKKRPSGTHSELETFEFFIVLYRFLQKPLFCTVVILFSYIFSVLYLKFAYTFAKMSLNGNGLQK